MIKDKTRVYYIGKRDGDKHEQVITVATEVQDDNTLRVGISFCSPKDQFVKAEGRKRAIGRMNSRGAEVVPFSGHSSDDIVKLINGKSIFHDSVKCQQNGVSNAIIKPNVWEHRQLISNETTGLSYVSIR